MFNKIKKVTAVITAGALVAGTFALNVNFLGNDSISVVHAAEILDFDSASSVNFNTILGRGTDYGLLLNKLVVESHMETTYAIKDLDNSNGHNDDVDLSGTAPAHIILASVSGGRPIFGHTRSEEHTSELQSH